MGIEVKILADSVSPAGNRLTTLELKFPRFILAQFNTHRMLSRNARSSRAVPVEKAMQEVAADPVIPAEWGRNQRGMVAEETLSEGMARECRAIWLTQRDNALHYAGMLMRRKVHKQIVNRLLEPWMWAYVVASATEWANFFALRTADDAQPEMRELARLMALAMRASTPARLGIGDWHLPYVSDDERRENPLEDCRDLSVARCGRVSYAPFDGNADIPAERARAMRFIRDRHASPLEHQGTPTFDPAERSGNFRGWLQWRGMVGGMTAETFDLAAIR